jgi:hypothetical protein
MRAELLAKESVLCGPMTCDSQDLTLQAILSNGAATVRQTFRRCSAQWLLRGRRNGASLCLRLTSSTIPCGYRGLLPNAAALKRSKAATRRVLGTAKEWRPARTGEGLGLLFHPRPAIVSSGLQVLKANFIDWHADQEFDKAFTL